jgi:polyisoprenoid-binding protein YceI
MKIIILIITLFYFKVANSDPISYIIDPGHTYPSFTIDHFKLSKTIGFFENTSGKVSIDWEKNTGNVSILIDTSSINTGHKKRDEHLRNPDFFDVENYPFIKFNSDKLIFNNGSLIKIIGKLEILGKSNNITLDVDNINCIDNHPIKKVNACGASMSGLLNRSKYGMNKYIPAISDEVILNIQVEVLKQ